MCFQTYNQSQKFQVYRSEEKVQFTYEQKLNNIYDGWIFGPEPFGKTSTTKELLHTYLVRITNKRKQQIRGSLQKLDANL
uniref:AAA_23 domain-containing protein n=1 Tax=Steinernema glaseri TaxID=37863 RepID=A0A1I7ZXH3_9BILA